MLSCVGVIVSYVIMITSNVLSSTTQIFNNKTNVDISRENPTFLTPSGITFAVWGPIYLFELALVFYQTFGPENELSIISRARFKLMIAFLLNAVWLPLFAYEYWWISMGVLLAYVLTINNVYSILNINYADGKSIITKLFSHIGISMNLAWITIALFLNIFIVSRNSDIVTTTVKNVTIGGNVDMATSAVFVVFIICIYKLIKYADIIYAFTTAWGLLGIYMANKNNLNRPTQTYSNRLQDLCIVFIAMTTFIMLIRILTCVCKKKTRDTNEIRQPLV